MQGRRAWAVLGSLMVLHLTTAPAADSAGGLKRLRVDAAATIGRFDLAVGVSGNAPIYWDGTDFSEDLRRAGVTDIRTHDADATLDWYLVFPDWNADPEDPASYNFTEPRHGWKAADDKMADIVNNGFVPYLRLGISWNTIPDNTDGPRHPPGHPDFDPGKWASICRHIIMHYNDGWADGFHYGIKWVEVWNEPDGAGEPVEKNRFWKGTPEQFIALYEHTARALKAYNPELQVGTCGLSLMDPKDCASCPRDYFHALVDRCAEAGVPLDFYSWHRYAPQPGLPASTYLVSGDLCAQYLSAKGLGHVAQHVTEWNAPGDEHPLHDSPLAAASTASTLMYFVDMGVTRCHFHPAYGAWGLISPDDAGAGGRPKAYWRKKTHAFRAFHLLQHETPNRLEAQGMERNNYAMLAGRSDDGRLIQVLVSDQDSRARGFLLEVDNLPSPASYTVEYLVIDGDHNLEVVAVKTKSTTRRRPAVELKGDLVPPGVMLVRILRNQAGSRQPSGGSARADLVGMVHVRDDGQTGAPVGVGPR